MPKRILPSSRPKISRAEIESIIAYHKAFFPHLFTQEDAVILVGIRGYYLETFGGDSQNNINCYDDAIIGISPRYFKTFNANVDPSFVKDPQDNNRPLARLKLGVYRFYKGLHKNQYKAFRAYPEGVKLPCTRAGVHSLCQLINIHYGGENPQSWYVTWSHGCQTIPKTQFLQEFQPEIYGEMTKYNQKTVIYILIEKVEQGYRAANNQIIPENFKVQQLVAATQPEQQSFDNVPTFQEPNNSMPVTLFDQQQIQAPASLGNSSETGETVTSFTGVDPQQGTMVQQQTTEPAVGTRPNDDPIQVSTGANKTLWATIMGTVMGGIGVVKGFFSDNLLLIVVGIICATLVILALIFRTVIMDYARLQLFGDPNKYNAK